MTLEREGRTATIKSVDKALEILEAFSNLNGGIKLSHLSKRLNMNRSGVHRLLQAFMKRGYIEQKCKNGEYRLGMTAHMVGQNIVSNMDLLNRAKQVMESLAQVCNETVYLVLPYGQEALMFDISDSRHPVNVMSLKGRYYPMSACAAGDMLQAFGAQSGGDAFSKPFQNDARLTMLKQQGYSMDAGRLGDGVVSLAVPLLNAEKNAVGSLCFVGPDFRFTDEKIKSSLLLPLIDAGHAISAKLGYFGYHPTLLPSS